jgi:hypothetical protein
MEQVSAFGQRVFIHPCKCCIFIIAIAAATTTKWGNAVF